MKCKNCGREIIRIRLGGRSVACDAAPITYWSVRGGAAMSEAIPLLTPNGESVYGALDGKLKDAVGMAYHPHTCGLLPIFHRGRDSWSRPIYDDGEGCFLVDQARERLQRRTLRPGGGGLHLHPTPGHLVTV